MEMIFSPILAFLQAGRGLPHAWELMQRSVRQPGCQPPRHQPPKMPTETLGPSPCQQTVEAWSYRQGPDSRCWKAGQESLIGALLKSELPVGIPYEAQKIPKRFTNRNNALFKAYLQSWQLLVLGYFGTACETLDARPSTTTSLNPANVQHLMPIWSGEWAFICGALP